MMQKKKPFHFVFRCVRQERISIRGSVRPSIRPSARPSVTPVQKPHFSDVLGHGEVLKWNKWSTNMFWECPLLLSRFTRLFVHLPPYMSHDQYTQIHSPDASLSGRACFHNWAIMRERFMDWSEVQIEHQQRFNGKWKGWAARPRWKNGIFVGINDRVYSTLFQTKEAGFPLPKRTRCTFLFFRSIIFYNPSDCLW